MIVVPRDHQRRQSSEPAAAATAAASGSRATSCPATPCASRPARRPWGGAFCRAAATASAAAVLGDASTRRFGARRVSVTTRLASGCGCARCASETAGGVPRARGRRVYSEADPGGYYLSALGGRGRRCRCAERSETAGGARRRPAVPSARHRCRAEIAALRVCVFDWASSFGCEGNVPSTHHSSAKGPVVRLNATTKTAQARGPRGVAAAAARGNSTTQEDVRAGAAVPEGRSAQGGGAADGSREPRSLLLQATGGFMLHAP